MELDENRDEIRLSRVIVDRLQGRFRFVGTSSGAARAPLPVDVLATNEQLLLRGRRLDEFSAVAPNDHRVIQLAEVRARAPQLEPKDIVILLLCGGRSFRSGGQVHPLKVVQGPTGGPATSLLSRQLNRLVNSSLQQSTCYVVGTLLNQESLEAHLANLSLGRRYRVYAGGLAPTLSPSQPRNAPPLIMRDISDRIAYNPIGHLEALRWFILSGILLEAINSKVVITVSYSNWGRIFTDMTVSLAGLIEQLAEDDPRVLLLVEVTRVLSGQEKGSILVAGTNALRDLRLIKPNYSRGEVRLPNGPGILLSTNTLYFSVSALVRRLQEAAPAVGLAAGQDSLLNLLRDAAAGVRRDKLADVFEAAFPIEAQLIPTQAAEAGAFLRAERDLDQLSLIPGPSLVEAVEVGPDRAVFLKLPSDFDNPAKLAYLFEA